MNIKTCVVTFAAGSITTLFILNIGILLDPIFIASLTAAVLAVGWSWYWIKKH